MASPKTSKPPKLTLKQTAFRDAILSGFMPSVAYKKAFDAKAMSPRAVSEEARKLLKNPKIALAMTLGARSGLQDCPRNDPKALVLPPLPPRVRLSMEERLEVMEAAVRVDPYDYFDELNHFKAIRDMPKHVRMAIASFKVDPLSFVTEVKFVDRIGAVRTYSLLAGDLPDNKKVAPPRVSKFDLTKLTDEELKEHMRLRRKAMVQEEEAGA